MVAKGFETTSCEPLIFQAHAMRAFLLRLLVFLCSLGAGAVLASLPTKFPTVVSPSQFPMLPLEQDEWQFVFNALRGLGWEHCNKSYEDPCSFAAINCLSPIRVVCDQNKRIFEIVLPHNNLTGQLPESSLQVLGRNLKLLDLTANPGIALARGRTCAQLDFCFREGVRCRLDFPLCERQTPGPTGSPPMNPSDAYLYSLMRRTLSGSNTAPALCPFSPHLTCVLADGELFISELSLASLGLNGFFPYEESTLGFLSKLTKFDISNNPELDLEWNDEDCFRFDACLPGGGVQCNFTNTRLDLCSAPALPSIDSQMTGLRISDELLAYWQWFYLLLNLSSLADPECVNTELLYTDPCGACPRRIVCVPGQGSGLLVFHSILLGNAKLRGQISPTPLLRFFNLGLQRFSLASTNASLANVVTNANASAPCLSLPPCSQLDCDFAGLIALCAGGATSSPTVSLVPTRQPTLSEQGDSVCGTTTGGFAPEGTRCAVPFTYASTTYRSCLSFASSPPLRNDSLPVPTARVPTDLWCPTVAKYNLLTANDWGFCDCFKNDQVTSRPTSLAPAVQFSSAPTLLPTASPTTSLPTASPTTLSQTLPPSTLTAWTSVFDSLNGNEWTACSGARTDPCSCKTAQVYVTCSAGQANRRRRRQLLGGAATSITEIVLPNNNCNGALPASGVQALTNQGLTLLNLEGGSITLLPTTATCQDVCVPSLTVCTIGSTCVGSGTSAPVDIVPIVVGVVVGVVVLCCLLVICFKCRDRRPSSSSKKKPGDALTVASTATTAASSSKPVNPAFAAMVGKAESKSSNVSANNNQDGDQGFAALKDGEDVEANNVTLEDAKLAALKLDDAARKDVPDVEAFLENLDLAKHIPAMRARAPGGKLDMIFMYKLSEASQRDMGMTMGERVRLKRALDIRKGLANDPVFGTSV